MYWSVSWSISNCQNELRILIYPFVSLYIPLYPFIPLFTLHGKVDMPGVKIRVILSFTFKSVLFSFELRVRAALVSNTCDNPSRV